MGNDLVLPAGLRDHGGGLTDMAQAHTQRATAGRGGVLGDGAAIPAGLSGVSSASTPTGERVTVICRMPSGLVLDLYDGQDLALRATSAVPVMGPPVPKASVRLRGARQDPRFHARDNRLLGLGGRTEVDRAFWEAWLAQNPGFGPLRAGLVFAQAREDDALAELAERAPHRTGLEGLEPDSLPGITPLNAGADG